MKHIYNSNKPYNLFSLVLLALVFLFPGNLPGQNGNGNNKEINILVSCVEYIGNGQLKVHFGYENPSNKIIVIDVDGSVVLYNHGQAKKAGLYSFEPGLKEKAFSQDFDYMDEVEWSVTLPNGNVKTVTANINYNKCSGDGLPIIPGYNPPDGGKEYGSKIGAELTALHEAFDLNPNFSDAPKDIFQIRGSRVLIEVVANTDPDEYEDLLASLTGLITLETSDPALNRATGWAEIADLLLYNAIDALHFGRPVFPGVGNAVSHYLVPPTGLTKSQGDFAMHSDFARLGYAIDGTGVKIGVLSNSYDTQLKASQNVIAGDLPGVGNIHGNLTPVQVLKDINPVHGTLSDEGRAMLQIVHDIAPGAELAFRTGYLGEKDMALGIRQLANAGADVIVDDLSYITEPFFRDGIISQTIDSVVSEGVTFFSSAGNFGRASYMGVFDSTSAPLTISGTAHDFSGDGDIFQGVLLHEGNYTLVLQWDDGSDITMNTTTTDLDLFLSDDAGFSLLGFNRENVGGFPIEVVPFSVVGDSVYANVVIARASGPENVEVKFKYILFRGGSQFEMLEYDDGGSSTIVGHPNAEGAISVGAVRFDKNPIYNSDDFPVPVIMSFSSIGGTPVDGEVRAKPDITAPNGVNTTLDLGNGDWISPIDPDTLYPNFFGTSAASPHAAGMAALLIEGKAKFDGETAVTPEYIRTVMKATALEMEDEGGAYNYVSGSGFIQAHKALMTFAQPSPYVQNLILASEAGVPGQEITPFSFTITGDFFTDSTQVLFRGDTLDTGVVVVDGSTITVDHEGFIGNPDIQIYNPPISNTEEDGGVSEVITFSTQPIQKIVISARNRVKKFGEDIPVDSASFVLITVGGDSLSFEEALQDTLMLQAEVDRLKGLAYTIPANDVSDAGQYPILPSLYPEVDTVNPAEIDLAISEKYIVEFKSGNLTIEKLGLTITPMDTSLVYGETLPEEGFDFSYQVSDSSIVITSLDSILQSVMEEHTDALTNQIALVRGVALVNGIPLIRGTALVNGVTMLRGIALVNGVEVKVEVEGSDTIVYVAGEPLVNGGSLIRGVALVNDRPFVSMTEIVRGVALVNGSELNFADGYMSLDDDPVANGIPVQRGVALVNGLSSRGIALVNGHTVEVDEYGVTTIDSVAVPTDGLALVNGIPVLRGTALVNSSFISRGVALVNGLEVVIENGIPTGRGIALVNGQPTLRGIALVNGLPLIRGTALVNNLEVFVDDGEVVDVLENGGPLANGFNLSRGIALVNGVALVNGSQLRSRGTALVNGIALTDDDGDGDEFVNLANMNFMASSAALANGLNKLRGIALVNGLDSEDGKALKVAAGTVQEDGSIVFENGFSSRGVALVNGLNYIRGTALVNGSALKVRGTALVNGSTINDNSNNGSIMVFDATELGDTTDNNVGFTPISFITGTTVGQHWIVPGTYISNNFDISYGLGTLTIDPAPLTITAVDKIKTYGEEDPELTYTASGLLGVDALSGGLNRDEGEDVGAYAIRQGSLTAGGDYSVHYDSAVLSIGATTLTVAVDAASKLYDGTREAVVILSDNRLPEDTLIISFSSALFADKHVDSGKEVTVLGISLGGADADNYTFNESATDTASIFPIELVIGITAEDKDYNGNTNAATSAYVVSGMITNDILTVTSSNGTFSTENAGTGLSVSADVTASGTDAGNYNFNVLATDTASIFPIELVIGITAEDKDYNGNTNAVTSAYVVSGMITNDILTVTSSNGTFSTENAGTGLSVSADVTASGTDAGNYNFNVLATDTASIFPVELVIGITAEDKDYNGNTNAVTSAYVVSGLLGEDAVTVTSSGGYFSTANAGTGLTVTANVTKSGDDAGNYYANTEATGSADIRAIELVIGITAEDKDYNGNTNAATSAYVVSGLLGEDAVTVTSSGGYFSTANAGTGLTVTANVTATGGDVGNYTVNSIAMTLADINQKEVYVTPLEDEFSIAMKDPLPDPAFDYDGWIAGDEENFGYTAIRDSDGIAYDIASKKSYGHYILTPVPSSPNYSFIVETGLLYVRKHNDVGHSDDDHDHHSKSAAVSGAVVEVDELEADYLNVYPNPVVEKVNITMKDIENYKMIQLYDFSGRSHTITSIDKRTDNLEIDMAQLPAGNYIIRIIMEDTFKVVKIIKE